MTADRAERRRLDVLLVERGLAESRERAQALILAGNVTADGRKVDKASTLVKVDSDISCTVGSPYVSRGAYKLLGALERFAITVEGRVALDAGASTGGFTEVLLGNGAARVYAADVGYGQLSWKLRTDPRVVVMERTNVRYLSDLPEPVDVVTADLSFISLTLVLARLAAVAAPTADFILLIKPQFEAGRSQVGKGGVVRDPAVHRAVLEKVTEFASTLGLALRGLVPSPILGPAGNVEFLGWYRRGEADGAIRGDVASTIEQALGEASALKPEGDPTH